MFLGKRVSYDRWLIVFVIHAQVLLILLFPAPNFFNSKICDDALLVLSTAITVVTVHVFSSRDDLENLGVVHVNLPLFAARGDQTMTDLVPNGEAWSFAFHHCTELRGRS